jgi:phosphoribosylformylglycinamidine cyclo-ligase
VASTYASAGVDIDAGDRAVELMKASVARTDRPEVIGGLGGFAGLFDASRLKDYRRPVLVTGTDGVGTKIVIAQRVGRHDTVGIDLVAMVVDDLVVCGAEPLFLTDYIACGRLDPDRIAAIVAGVAEGCVQAGCALLGGETAEHPGVMAADDYDLAAAGTGVVEADRLLGAERVRPGDAIIALRSSGLHSNGYSLVRKILSEGSHDLGRHVEDFGRSLGEELLEPTRVYARTCLALMDRVDVHAFSHITGGGITGNLARVLPSTVDATLDRSTWQPQPVFAWLGAAGHVDREELERTFNMGLGMLAVVAADDAATALESLRDADVDAWQIGETTPGTGEARLVSSPAT